MGFEEILRMKPWMREAAVQLVYDRKRREHEAKLEQQPLTEQNAAAKGVHPSVAKHDSLAPKSGPSGPQTT